MVLEADGAAGEVRGVGWDLLVGGGPEEGGGVVDDDAILLAIFDDRTTVGMVRLFAKDVSRKIALILVETRSRPAPLDAFAVPLRPDEAPCTFPAA